MTIYTSFKKRGFAKMRRRHTRQEHKDRQTRALHAFTQQWKRYPHCRNIRDLQSGFKTHTGLFKEGYDPVYREAFWADDAKAAMGWEAYHKAGRIA